MERRFRWLRARVRAAPSAFLGWREVVRHVAPSLLVAGMVAACNSGGDAASAGQSYQELTSTDGSTGVPECDSYLDRFEQCMQQVLPADQFTQQKTGIKRQRLAWKALADSPAKRAALAQVCLAASRTAKEELASCSFAAPVCGNGAVEVGESCDDGNVIAGDGCSATCAREPTCTDSVKNGSETDVDCGGSCAAKCALGKSCATAADCQNNVCTGGVCGTAPACSEASATDLGAPGGSVLVKNNACVRVRDGYPSWWGSARVMQLQTQQGGTYPAPYSWTNSCAASSGSGTFTADSQAQLLNKTSSSCATVIKLGGSGAGNVRLSYFGQ